MTKPLMIAIAELEQSPFYKDMITDDNGLLPRLIRELKAAAEILNHINAGDYQCVSSWNGTDCTAGDLTTEWLKRNGVTVSCSCVNTGAPFFGHLDNCPMAEKR